ncbi:MAG: sigma-54-dependent Fis family transcriptional regulator [Treponema sp.]|nr:sigma-54-dependent Fis family transcriptional regulator [Treponema sp.]
MLNSFRQLFSSVCKVHLYSDLTDFCSRGLLSASDYILVDACFLKQLHDCTDLLRSFRQDKCFFITDDCSHVFIPPHFCYAMLSFPQDVPLLFRSADSSSENGDSESQKVLDDFVGESPCAETVRKQIAQAAKSDIPVLITGETGTGKGVAAELIHRLSSRRAKSMVPVNMAAFQTGLAASELFGTVRGAFTDAVTRTGYFEKAKGTTLFLDEIGDLKLDLQAQLLHVIECGRYQSVGSHVEKYTDARLIFATNADLKAKVERNEFRSDFYYRISHALIQIPPLRERKMDIIPIARFILRSSEKKLSSEAEKALLSFEWPGNVRQLKHCLERAMSQCEETYITAEHIIFD